MTKKPAYWGLKHGWLTVQRAWTSTMPKLCQNIVHKCSVCIVVSNARQVFSSGPHHSLPVPDGRNMLWWPSFSPSIDSSRAARQESLPSTSSRVFVTAFTGRSEVLRATVFCLHPILWSADACHLPTDVKVQQYWQSVTNLLCWLYLLCEAENKHAEQVWRAFEAHSMEHIEPSRSSVQPALINKNHRLLFLIKNEYLKIHYHKK